MNTSNRAPDVQWGIDYDHDGKNFSLYDNTYIVISTNQGDVVALVPKEDPTSAYLIQSALLMRQQMQEALRWLREHAGYMSNEVREGYTATCDGLEATINTSFPPTKEA